MNRPVAPEFGRVSTVAEPSELGSHAGATERSTTTAALSVCLLVYRQPEWDSVFPRVRPAAASFRGRCTCPRRVVQNFQSEAPVRQSFPEVFNDGDFDLLDRHPPDLNLAVEAEADLAIGPDHSFSRDRSAGQSVEELNQDQVRRFRGVGQD